MLKYFPDPFKTLFTAIFFLASFSANAVVEIYEFDSEHQRLSYQKLTEELRCPKCQNQNLADSNSEISDIMRDVIYEQLQAGASEDEIKQVMVDRYGEFVLYAPPIEVKTMILWGLPIVLLGAALLAFVVVVGKRGKTLNTSADTDD